jgi:hypothetical protein
VRRLVRDAPRRVRGARRLRRALRRLGRRGRRDDAQGRARAAHDLRARSGPALHLWHPRSHATTLGHADYASNLALLADYARYDETTLARLFEVGRQTFGYRDKYVPLDR